MGAAPGGTAPRGVWARTDLGASQQRPVVKQSKRLKAALDAWEASRKSSL